MQAAATRLLQAYSGRKEERLGHDLHTGTDHAEFVAQKGFGSQSRDGSRNCRFSNLNLDLSCIGPEKNVHCG